MYIIFKFCMNILVFRYNISFIDPLFFDDILEVVNHKIVIVCIQLPTLLILNVISLFHPLK